MIFKNLASLFSAIIVGTLILTSAPAEAAKKPKMTPMELQSIQSREFEVSKDMAFGAVMTVIQDLGYTVESADLGSGFITAASPTENKTGFFEALGGSSASGNTVMTAFLLQMPNGRTRIRLNFVNTKSSSTAYGRDSRQDKPILEASVYNNAWERIDEALFVMGALVEPSQPASKSSDVESDDDEPVEAISQNNEGSSD
ncbi:MAG: hypothetical protein WAT93_01525 [Pontixanthobacter sp.]